MNDTIMPFTSTEPARLEKRAIDQSHGGSPLDC